MPKGIPKNGINKGWFKIGRISIITEETKKKISKTLMGHLVSEKTRKKFSELAKGRKNSEESNRKRREWYKNNPDVCKYWLGEHQPEESNKKRSDTLKRIGHKPPVQRGKDNVNYKGGISLLRDKIRHSLESRAWQKFVFTRDNFTCAKYGIKGGKLVVHHILNFSSHTELRFAIDNGITLSLKAHKEFHKIYGTRNNNREQLIEFLNK